MAIEIEWALLAIADAAPKSIDVRGYCGRISICICCGGVCGCCGCDGFVCVPGAMVGPDSGPPGPSGTRCGVVN